MIAPRSIVLVFMLAFISGLSACGHEARLIRDTPTGGLISYPIETEAAVLSSNGRREALRLIRDKCPQGSRLLKEGELPKVSQSADRLWRGQMGTERVWGIQFLCEPTTPH